MSKGTVDKEATQLQRIIFGRYVRQKLLKRNMDVKDIVLDARDGQVLLALLEVLSEKNFEGKGLKEHKGQRVQIIDNVNNVLSFIWKSGVELKLKPSAENIADGDERSILGLVWAIMLKFMKIGDDDDEQSLNAKDALLLWAKNKTQGYNHIPDLKSYKDFNNGLALCAIIHKHRPGLIDYDSLSPTDGIKNLEIAQEAALKYFDLEKYITPQQIQKLDENSMVVYVAEYYYGIAEQRKLDLAAKRISKVVKLTVENDALRTEYKKNAEEFIQRLEPVKVQLGDRTIDNTLAGAKKRIEDFYVYKTQKKGKIIENQLALEGIYNNLSMRLAHNKRPPFQPPKGVSLADVVAAVKLLEEHEQERKVALHAELNRQLKLVELNKYHVSLFDKLHAWYSEKEPFLRKKEDITSVSEAQLQLRLLEAFDNESSVIVSGTVALMKKLGAELLAEKYEHSDDVRAREQQVDTHFATLSQLSSAKHPVLDDDLVRELFKEKVRLWVSEHRDNAARINVWIEEKEAYLHKKEEVHSVADARTQLGLLDSYEQEKRDVTSSAVSAEKKLGSEILAAKHHTQYSQWAYEHPDEITGAEGHIDSKWEELSRLSAAKLDVLKDDLAREEYAEHTRTLNSRHEESHRQIMAWVSEKEAYLHKKETVENVNDARNHLNLLDSYFKDRERTLATRVKALTTLGAEILARKYETHHSTYVYEHPENVKSREESVSNAFNHTLPDLSAKKKAVLESDLARELEKERLRLDFAHLTNSFLTWAKDQAHDAAMAQFGFTLEEVEAFQAILSSSEAALKADADSKETATHDVKKAMDNLHVTYNHYTKLTLADVSHARTTLEQALAQRRTAYETELARQRYNDNLCKKFSEAAEPLQKQINDWKTTITTSQAELEDQLKFVDERLSHIGALNESMKPIHDLQTQMDEAGITNNRYTVLTSKDLDVAVQQFEAFLRRKKEMLEKEIENKKLKGLTPQDLKEIQENFNQFDTDKDGKIDKREFKAALYSLGEEKTRSEIEQLLQQRGDGKTLDYNGFKGFMVELLGVSDTKEDILGGFELISRGKVTNVDRLRDILPKYDFDYFIQTAPKVNDVPDYVAWSEDVFSR